VRLGVLTRSLERSDCSILNIASNVPTSNHLLKSYAMTAAVASAPEPIPLGSSVPALTAHAISVSLPTWEDNIGYEEGDKRVVDKMETGYPRFFVHRSIQKVSLF
jgi:hypothetical protein